MEHSRLDNSSRISDNKSNQPDKVQSAAQSVAQTRISHPRKSNHGRGVLSRHNESDQMTAINEERENLAKEEEKKLVIDEALLKYTLTGLMVADSEPYAFIDNPKPSLFTDSVW